MGTIFLSPENLDLFQGVMFFCNLWYFFLATLAALAGSDVVLSEMSSQLLDG